MLLGEELQLEGLPDWTRILRSAASVQQWLGQGQPETLGLAKGVLPRIAREICKKLQDCSNQWFPVDVLKNLCTPNPLIDGSVGSFGVSCGALQPRGLPHGQPERDLRFTRQAMR